MKVINPHNHPFTFHAGREPSGAPIRVTVGPHGGSAEISDEVYAKIKHGLAGHLSEVTVIAPKIPTGGDA